MKQKAAIKTRNSQRQGRKRIAYMWMEIKVKNYTSAEPMTHKDLQQPAMMEEAGAAAAQKKQKKNNSPPKA